MKRDGVSTAVTVLGLLLGVGYIAAGLIGWAADVTDGGGSDLAFWLIFLVGGGALILVGLYLVRTPMALSVALSAIGAIAGAVAVFWSVLVPILTLVFVALLIVRARRAPEAPAVTT